MRRISTGARPATYTDAYNARLTIVALSTSCAVEGVGCLRRSISTALLCRLDGTWPTWHVGARTEPFGAHSWVEVRGQPVGEPYPAGYYQPLMTVAVPARD